MEVGLQILVGKNAGQEVPVSAESFLIGRADECKLRPKSEFISRRHCEIKIAESKAYVVDLGSRTGTFVNGRLIPANRDVELQAGDTLKVGPLEFGVVFKHGLKKAKKPKVEGIEGAAAAVAARNDQGDESISDWLRPDDADMSLGETLDGDPGQTLLSAADFIGQAGSNDEKKADDASPPKVDPRQAAAEALRKHLRRG